MSQSADVLRNASHWEGRAQRYASEGRGLAAVCAYGMPAFYNRAIELCQTRALQRWLNVPRIEARTTRPRVLDVGCGVARWSLRLAHLGYQVTGIDLSPTMVEIARARAAAVGEDCEFQVGDVCELALGGKFDLILSVTVLQHVVDASAARAAIGKLAAHLLPGGRLVLLEAAPPHRASRCENFAFRVRPVQWYHDALRDAGLQLLATTGVDPTPLKTWLLPHYARLPRPLAVGALLAATAISLPIDLAFGRFASVCSWHKVIVAHAPAFTNRTGLLASPVAVTS
jgi:SAM-dependent methyltransferase